MAKTIEQLKAQSAEVKNASVIGENTATRVGNLFNDIVEKIEQETADGATTTDKLAPLAVTTSKIANGAVTSEKTNFIAQELGTSEKLVPSVNVVRNAVNAEAEERKNQDVIIATQLSNEIERAKGMELGISTKLNDEIKRAQEVENDLQEQITSEAEACDLAINNEAQARTQNDQLLSQAITVEQERAEAAEQTNATAINTQDQKLSELEEKMSINSDVKSECHILDGKRINQNGSIGNSADNSVFVLEVNVGDIIQVKGQVTYACDYILYRNFDGLNLSDIVMPWSSAEHYKTDAVVYEEIINIREHCYACFGSLNTYDFSIAKKSILEVENINNRLKSIESEVVSIDGIIQAISHNVNLVDNATLLYGKLSNDQNIYIDEVYKKYRTYVIPVKIGQTININCYGFYSIAWSKYSTFDGTSASIKKENALSPWGTYITEKANYNDTIVIDQDCYLAVCCYVAEGDSYEITLHGYLTASEIDEKLTEIPKITEDVNKLKKETFGEEPTSKSWNINDIYYAPLKRIQAWNGKTALSFPAPGGTRVKVRLLRPTAYKGLPFDIMCDDSGSPSLYPIRDIEDEDWHIITTKGDVTKWGFAKDGYEPSNDSMTLEVDVLSSLADRVDRVENDLYNTTKKYALNDALLAWMNGEKFPVGFLGDSTTDGVSTTGWDANINSHCTCDAIAFGARPLNWSTNFSTTVCIIPSNERHAGEIVSFYSNQFFVKRYNGISFDDSAWGNEDNWDNIDVSLYYGKGDWQHPKSYPYLLEKLLQKELSNDVLRIYNIGYSGASFTNQKSVLKELFNGAYNDVKMVGIELGINDRVKKATDVEYYNSLIENLKYYVEFFLSKNITPFMVTTQAWFQNGDNGSGIFNDVSQNYTQILCNKAKYKVANEYGLEVVNMNEWGAKFVRCSEYPMNDITQDSLHFRDIGHKAEADYLFTKFVPWVLSTNLERKVYVGVTNICAKSEVITANYIYGEAAQTGDGFRKQINKTKSNTNDTLIYDAYVFVNEGGVYNVKYLTPVASGYILIDGDTSNTIQVTSTEMELGSWDMGLHHVQVYTGATNKVAFKGFLLEQS